MKYYLSSSDQVTGPYDKEELIDSFKDGMISPDSMICEEGADDWLPVASLTEKKAKTEITPAAQQTPFTELQEAAAAPITVHQNDYQTKSAWFAILLEVVLGLCLFTFGIGNLYAGNIATGLILMFTYWALTIVNLYLLFLLIGYITLPITVVVYLVIAIISAQKAANRFNSEMIMKVKRRAAPPQSVRTDAR